MSGIGAAR